MRVRTLTIDLNQKKYEKLLYKQFDNNIEIKINLIDNGIPVNLEGCTVSAFFDNGVEISQKNCTIAGNVVTTVLDNVILKYQGLVEAEFNIVKGDTIVTSFTMLLEVEPSIDRNTAVTTQPEWDMLTNLKNELKEAIELTPNWLYGNDTPTETVGDRNDFYLKRGNGEVFYRDIETNKWKSAEIFLKGYDGENVLELIEDVKGTAYKKGQKINIDYLRTIQMQSLNDVFFRLRNKTSPVTFCHRGDSLTYGYDTVSADKRENTTTYADGSTYNVTKAGKTYPEAMEECLKLVYGADLIGTHINRGRGGDYASASLTRHNEKHNGDITLLMLGTNDSRHDSCPYKGNVKEFIRYMEQIIAQELLWDKAVVLLKSPIIKLQNDFKVDVFSNAVSFIGAKYGIPVIDTQELLEGYAYSIWSDATHFNTKGYSLLGSRIASVFIGEGLTNPIKIKGGRIITVTGMKSSCTHDSNVTHINTGIANIDTPNEHTAENGYYLRFGKQGAKATFSFYAEEENLFIIPSLYIAVKCEMKIKLDNGFNGANVMSSAIYDTNGLNNKFLPHEEIVTATDTVAIRYNKSYLRDNLRTPLRISNKGWHTITIELTKGEASSLFGIEFVSYDVLNNSYKGRKKLIYENPKAEKTPKDTLINLTDDLSKYEELYIKTGGTEQKTLITSLAATYQNKGFTTADIIAVKTFNGNFVATIQTTKQLKVVQADDVLRKVYGVMKEDL